MAELSFIEQTFLGILKDGPQDEKALTLAVITIVSKKKQGNNPGATARLKAVLQELVSNGYIAKAAGGGFLNKKYEITEKGKQAIGG